jgi:hypothetical protein
MNTLFTKTINDRSIVKARRTIILNRIESIEDTETGEIKEVEVQTFNPTDEMLFADGWELYVLPETPEKTEDEIFNEEKQYITEEIIRYDSSREVNEFYIQEMPVWLDKATRAGLMLRFNSELALKKDTTTLWYEGQSFTLPLNTAMQMLYALEVYASECYDNTQLHLANVEKLETLEELKEYDYRGGYPEKLHF